MIVVTIVAERTIGGIVVDDVLTEPIDGVALIDALN